MDPELNSNVADEGQANELMHPAHLHEEGYGGAKQPVNLAAPNRHTQKLSLKAEVLLSLDWPLKRTGS